MTDLSSPAANAAQARARRRARLADSARLLPFLATAAFLLPDLVLSGGNGARATSPWLLYLFAVWIVLILLAVRIARRAARDRTLDGGEGGTP